MADHRKDRYIWNWKWRFWAKDGGRIGYQWRNGHWCYCWVEPNATKKGDDLLMGFNL